MLAVLQDPVYRRLFAAQVFSLVGTGLSSIALALLAYRIAGDDAGVVLGTALALKMIAYVGLAPIVGAFAHRLPRKGLLVGLDVLRAGLVLLFPFVDAVWQIYLLIFLLNAGSAAFTPTFQAAIPDVLPDEARYTRALSLSRLAYDLENLLSPALAALLLTVTSFDTLFVLNSTGFVISGALVLSAAMPAAVVSERAGGVIDNLTFGIRSYLATPRLRGLLALNFGVAMAGAMIIVNTVVYVRDRLGGSETEVAQAMAAAGAGSMAVALLLPGMLDRLSDRVVMMTGGTVLGLGLALGAIVQPDFIGLLGIWLLLGAGSSLVQTPSGRLLRRSSHASDRAAYFSAQFALSHACWLLAYPLAGYLAIALPFSAVFAILAATAAVSTIVAMMVWPHSMPVEVEHMHQEMTHKHPHVHDEHHQHIHEGWEGPEPHTHAHRHGPMRHRHAFVIDMHHRRWPA